MYVSAVTLKSARAETGPRPRDEVNHFYFSQISGDISLLGIYVVSILRDTKVANHILHLIRIEYPATIVDNSVNHPCIRIEDISTRKVRE